MLCEKALEAFPEHEDSREKLDELRRAFLLR
jgi:hypothetical protein